MAEQDKLDKVLEHLDSIHTVCDSLTEGHKALSARMDAFEQDREKEKAEAKAKADAEEKEKADAAARAAANPELARKLAEIKRGVSTTLSLEDRTPFTDAQMRADAAYQALTLGQAPPSLHGETLNDYRVRLLSKIKQHSRLYKGSDLGALVIADSAAFSVVENAIVADAIEASCTPPPAGAPLREVTTRMPSGHLKTEFFGDPAVTWAPFMGGATKFGRINRPKQ